MNDDGRYDFLKHARFCWECGKEQDLCPHLFSRFGPTEEEAMKIRRSAEEKKEN